MHKFLPPHKSFSLIKVKSKTHFPLLKIKCGTKTQNLFDIIIMFHRMMFGQGQDCPKDGVNFNDITYPWGQS